MLCCDERYLPYAALTIYTLMQSNPDRDFDICIASLDALEVPPAIAQAGVRMCQISVGSAFDELPTSKRFSVAAYVRLALAEAFCDDYDRILYLDSDIMVVGEELGAVFSLDLLTAPVGAATDNMKLKYPRRPTPDQAALGVNGPYFNSGVLLIDTKAFVQQEIREKCIQVAKQHDPEKLHFDQTLLNLALIGNWARLHPAWNWQWSIVRPMFEIFIDTQIIHFVGTAKPWSDRKAGLPIRYREKARRFFAKYYPDLETNTAPPATKIRKSNLYARLIRHIGRTSAFVDAFNDHSGDIMKVLPPDFR